MRVTSKTVLVDDIEIACTVVGDGDPVIVVHGAIGLGSTYMRALDPWADELRLVYYDQRGSGDTPLGDVQKVSFAGGRRGPRRAAARRWASTACRCSGTRLAPTSPPCMPPRTPRPSPGSSCSTRARRSLRT